LLNRQVKEFGLNPELGYFLSIAAYIGFSTLFFSKLPYAECFNITAGLSMIQWDTFSLLL
jgi:hypothetical protein